ncbi:SRR1-like protein isoform X1 [Bolinopsis microptera]|uniref:SRR1-like protein isoform X1 n=1 Tax=Bolinopsis microptera TaxID=2820187 RepID=UPI00307A8658
METDGFVLVKPSRKRRIKSKKCPVLPVNNVDDEWDHPLDLTSVIKQVFTEDSVFCDKISEVISSQDIEQIVCYGIGRLSTCKLAQFQFAVLVNVLQKSPQIQKCLVFDPVLSQSERTFITQYMEVLSENDMCGRRVVCNTLFYMIHSSKRMYDNVLKSNWDQLKYCTLIGNSFQSYLLHSTTSSLVKQVPHIYTCTEHTKEDELPKFVSHHNVFNNTVIIEFLSSADTDSVFVNTLPADISEDGLEIQ